VKSGVNFTGNWLREKYREFFERRGHKWIPSAPLVPEGDSSTLFISAGMHPLVPYLLGEPHPLGKRLVDWQKCLRTEDIEGVGDTQRHTFFEMLGNWSLGDYFKKEAIAWSWEFLTKELQLEPERLSVTIFAGDENAPYDREAEKAWLAVGVPKERIFPMGKEENWWEAGKTGPGGPDTEIWYDTGRSACGPDCRPTCKCGKWFEIWNNVFMEYNRLADDTYQPLKQKNVDTGMGLERTVAVLQGHYDDYRIELLWPLVEEVMRLSGKDYDQDQETTRQIRVIVDHLRAATFVLAEEIVPSNVQHGYVLRRLIRRAVRFGRLLGISDLFTTQIAEKVIEFYQEVYPELREKAEFINQELEKEEKKFGQVLSRGLNLLRRQLEKLPSGSVLPGKIVFDLYQSYGFPPEMTWEEVARIKPGTKIDEAEFKRLMAEHQEKSRQAAKGLFRGGLAEQTPETIRLHTATHLLQQALRQVLGGHVHQVGSAITPEKLRFDFTHPQKLTPEEIAQVETIVNQKIREDLPVTMRVMSLAEAKKKGALTVSGKSYPEQVKVYSIGNFSIEVCGGPHVKRTGELGRFKIVKEEACGAGKRRIYGILEV